MNISWRLSLVFASMALLGIYGLFDAMEGHMLSTCVVGSCIETKTRPTNEEGGSSSKNPTTRLSSSSPSGLPIFSAIEDRSNQDATDYSFAVPGYTPPAGTLPMYSVQFGDFTYGKDGGFERISEAVLDESEYSRVLVNPKILRVDALHTCWAHAILDNWVYWFHGRKEFKGESFFLWFDRDYFIRFPVHQTLIDSDQRQYKPSSFKDLCDLLKPVEVVFEHLLDVADERILLKDAMVVSVEKDASKISAWALWDDASIYEGRPHNAERIPDSIRHPFYAEMREYILTEMELMDVRPDDSVSDKSTLVTIVARRGGNSKRKFTPAALQNVKSTVAAAGFGSPGLTFWEDMSFKEQLEKLRRTKFLIAKHGAGERSKLAGERYR